MLLSDFRPPHISTLPAFTSKTDISASASAASASSTFFVLYSYFGTAAFSVVNAFLCFLSFN